MTEEHPITPPPELLEQWQYNYYKAKIKHEELIPYVATQAARWGADQQLKLDAERINQAWQKGADQELEECCEWLKAKEWINPEFSDELRAIRRPKPPSLKEQALAALNEIEDKMLGPTIQEQLIRQALESLPD